MFKLPLVSFVVTSYNYAQYIEQTLESIKAQTYKNFEIIIVDDCSNDNSSEVIENFIQFNQDYKITFIKHENNMGQLASMLDGLRIAQGVFVSFVDSDDVLLPEFCQTHVKIHMATSVAFTSSQIVEIDENNEIHTTYSVSSPHKELSENIKNLDDLLNINVDNVEYEQLRHKKFGGWYWSPNSSAMFRKSSIDILLNYSNTDKWIVSPDKFLFNFANLVGGSVNIFAPLVAYRRHKDNAGNTDYVTGDKRYHSDKATQIHVEKNINIRPEMFCFLIKNRRSFIEKFGTRGFIKLLINILL